MTRDISVIIPVYNEKEVIRRCLESLDGQTLKPKEVIVVDDKSTDNTVKVVKGFLNRPLTYQLINALTHSGTGAARNLGASKAMGDILVFVDADMTFSRTFLSDLTQPIRERKSRGTFSKLEYVANWNNRWARYWNYWKELYEPRALPKDYPGSAPVFRAILRSEFQRSGGFDEKIGYDDDWSLSRKLEYQATSTNARLYHDNPSSLRDAFSQAVWTGKRRYKHGLFGSLYALARSFPPTAVITGVVKLLVSRKVFMESAFSHFFLYPLFLLVVNSGITLGIMKMQFAQSVSK